MISCEKCREYIERYVEGATDEDALGELKAHAEQCPSCQEEFRQFELMQEIVRDAFSCSTEPAAARDKVLAGLAERPSMQRERFATWTVALTGQRHMAVAASILVGIGLLFGYAMGKAASNQTAGEQLAATAPMQVAEIEGTVLVRHQDSETWHVLKEDSTVHLGDTFHSTARAGFALTMKDKSRIEVNQNSMLTLAECNGQIQFSLEHGECTADLKDGHPRFFIDTPHGRVEALGTEFTVTVTDE